MSDLDLISSWLYDEKFDEMQTVCAPHGFNMCACVIMRLAMEYFWREEISRTDAVFLNQTGS